MIHARRMTARLEGSFRVFLAATWCLCLLFPACLHATDAEPADVEKTVARAVRPVMEQFGIPGMAVGVVVNGQGRVFYYGVASKATGQPVGSDTLFEVGSVSKTFTATLAAYAQLDGALALSDPPSKYLPDLRASPFDRITLLQLGTHTAGDLPLQVPDDVTNDEQLTHYCRTWQPAYPPGAFRVYSNIGIGLLGRIAATSLHADFTALMEDRMFPALGLKDTFLRVPAARMEDYAQGYTTQDAPVRLAPGVLGAEAYGVRTTAADLLRFVEANLGLLTLDKQWQQALTDTHTAYYQVGVMTQDLIWEQYDEPVALPDLLAGNSDAMILKPNQAALVRRPWNDDVLLNKTGSTNGFSTYVAFIPARKTGVVLLANKRFPIDERVRLAKTILDGLADSSSPAKTP